MRVKKYEAKTMKEALQMVKNELGPDAVILGARDNRKSFGLGGDGSVEVTAAVSESTLHKKKFVESRLRESDREKFQRSPATAQKRIIARMTEERLQSLDGTAPTSDPRRGAAEVRSSRPITRVNYIDIGEDDGPRPPTPPARRPVAPAAPQAQGVSEIESLKGEVLRLQSLLDRFQKVPQTFIGAHPGADFGISYDLSFMFQKLSEAGIGQENSVEILNRAQAEMDPLQIKKRPLVDAFVARWFLSAVRISPQPYSRRMHAFVGPAGSGKTSSLVKMASHLVVNEKKKVAILTTDSFKVGAADQLKIYCQILNVPFAIVRNAKEWEWLLPRLAHIDHILVDFPGFQLRDIDEIHLLKSLLPPASAMADFHMVVSATAKDGDAFEAGHRYRVADFADVIFTNLDQSVQHGIIYNFQRKTGKPLHSFGIGSRIPEDFELATKERVLDLIFRLTRLRR